MRIHIEPVDWDQMITGEHEACNGNCGNCVSEWCDQEGQPINTQGWICGAVEFPYPPSPYPLAVDEWLDANY